MIDIKKIVKNLELAKVCTEWDKSRDCQIMIDEAIHSIRELADKECQQGRADAKKDVCEWKMPNDNADEWTPNCEKNSVFNVFGVAWFKYCPYCGRKIKAEE